MRLNTQVYKLIFTEVEGPLKPITHLRCLESLWQGNASELRSPTERYSKHLFRCEGKFVRMIHPHPE
jgi:hypothetical protein